MIIMVLIELSLDKIERKLKTFDSSYNIDWAIIKSEAKDRNVGDR